MILPPPPGSLRKCPLDIYKVYAATVAAKTQEGPVDLRSVKQVS